MQTSPADASGTLFPANKVVNSATFSLTAGNGLLAASAVCQPHDTTEIGLMALPAEVLAYIMRKMDNPIMLSMTCRQLRALYQDDTVYKPPERQFHLLAYNLIGNIKRNILRENLVNHLGSKPANVNCFLPEEDELEEQTFNIVIPKLDTPEWIQLKNYPLAPEAYSVAECVKKTYITAWELLLQTNIRNNRLQASELMRVILELVHYVDADSYVAQLFDGDFPWDFFTQLADVYLDRCLRLVASYFREFVPLLLQYGADCNIAAEGNQTALIQACHYQQEELVRLLLQQPNININVTNQDAMTGLHYAIRAGDLTIIQALLDTNKITTATCLSAFNYALEQGQDEIAGMLVATVEEEYPVFIAQALILAIDNDQAEVVEILKVWRTQCKAVTVQ